MNTNIPTDVWEMLKKRRTPPEETELKFFRSKLKSDPNIQIYFTLKDLEEYPELVFKLDLINAESALCMNDEDGVPAYENDCIEFYEDTLTDQVKHKAVIEYEKSCGAWFAIIINHGTGLMMEKIAEDCGFKILGRYDINLEAAV